LIRIPWLQQSIQVMVPVEYGVNKFIPTSAEEVPVIKLFSLPLTLRIKKLEHLFR
jgi:hypothetical protein